MQYIINFNDTNLLGIIYNLIGFLFLIFLALYNFSKVVKDKVDSKIILLETKLNDKRGIKNIDNIDSKEKEKDVKA